MMNVSYSFQTKKSGPGFKRFLKERLQFGLDRFESKIESVAVRVSDSDRNGAATCRIQLKLNASGKVQVNADGENQYLAATEAIQRLRKSLSRDNELRRRGRKIRQRRSIKRDSSAFSKAGLQ
ncbi:MAG: HPF/RaiA family ribosome-associated protein [Planctomycetaceae bacterium]|nr:HPF/RaiA family ribosome-associated protein [Planctomycetaceae bacterium]